MQCDRCRKRAVIHQPYSGLHLCREHFTTDFEAKAKRAIRKQGRFLRGDHIAVVLTGSEGDCALLQFLSLLTCRRRDVNLSAIVVTGGALRHPDIRSARARIASLGAGCITESCEKERGIPPDAQRHLLLHHAVRCHGVTKLALPTSLNDAAESVLAQVLRGTPDLLLQRHTNEEFHVPEIRPFMYAPLAEIVLYARLTIGTGAVERSSAPADAFAADVRDFLHDYTLRHPSAPYSLVSFCEQLASAGRQLRTEGRIPDEVA